jgi:hypothetical protein
MWSIVIACTVGLFVINTLLASRVIQRADDDGIGVCSPTHWFTYPVRTSKSRKIEMVRQNVKKVAADRRSNFTIRQIFYQMKICLSKLFAASLLRGI